MSLLTRDEETMLIVRYSQTHRHYHGLNHVRDLLAKHKLYKRAFNMDGKLVDKMIRYAIWYHDAVYSTHNPKGENEQRSMDLFVKHHPNPKGAMVPAMILMTRDHEVDTETLGENGQLVAGYFLSLDLSSFIEPWEVVKQNALNLRREYAQYTGEQWRQGTIAFLQGLLARPHLFPHPIFESMWRDRACNNIELEIEWLTNRWFA